MIKTLKNSLYAQIILDKMRSTYKSLILPEKQLKKIFLRRVGYPLNLDNPQTFNEKLNWLKLYWHNPLIPICVDKYLVRNYLKERGLGHLLNDLIAKYDSVEEIDLQKLPNRFVLKATHGSGWNIICKEKKLFDWSDAQKKLKRWMYDNYYFHSFEWPYKEIKPRIICEKFLQDEKRGELLDYKFMCFNGKVRCLFVCSDRHSPTGLKVDFYDLDWNIMPFYRYYPNSGKKIDKPKYLSEMVKYAEILSKPFPFVRVDFYEIEGNIIFGELTFFPGSGMEYFRPQSYDYVLGSWITLPSKQL